MGSRRSSRKYSAAHSLQLADADIWLTWSLNARCLSKGRAGISSGSGALKLLHDLEQPFAYDIRMYNRPYRFEFSDTGSPNHYTLLRPDFVILCFDINDRSSLENTKSKWRKEVYTYYPQEEARMPLMLLGLKRDLRREEEGMIWPQEGYKFAQGMRCDRYAECSAVTGELMHEVFEDIAKTAAKTTTANGGQSQGACVIT